MATRLLRLLALISLLPISTFAGVKTDFSSLPKNLAIVRSEGNGRRVFALFEDPLCPACKYFETQLDSLTDYTVYIYTYPILGRRSVETTTAVWCSSDPLHTWENAVGTRTALPINRSCLETVGKILELGQSYGVRATPTLIFENDTAVDGAVPAKYLSAMLDRAAKGPPAGRTDRQTTASASSKTSGPKLIEIPGGGPTSTPQPKAPAVFLFTNGDRIEAEDYMVTKDDLFITTNGQKHSYPVRSLDKPGTRAANIERGIVVTFPTTISEFNLNF
jgi:thioredoxin-related protein